MASEPRRLLLIEDEVPLAQLLRARLEQAGFGVQVARRGDDGLRLATSYHFDIIVLDLTLPGLDGLSLCRALRRDGNLTPLLMVTARGTEADKVRGLELGADDYIAKPFGMSELLARINAVLRRIANVEAGAAASRSPVHVGDDLVIDPGARTVMVRGSPVALTATEFDLLLHMARHPGRVFSRSQLFDVMWGYNHDGNEHAVNCHISRLRAKIEVDHAHPTLLLTVWGRGYKLAEGLAPRPQ